MQERKAARVSPRSAITAAIEEFDSAYAFGVVANISEGGACICTDRAYPVGEPVVVQLSFRGQEQPLPVEAYVRWCGHDAGDTYRCGLQWIGAAGGQLRRLIRDC